MKTLVTDIADGSQGFRVWFDEEPDSQPADSGERYQVVGVYERVSEDTCRVGYTMGDLSNEVNIEIAKGAHRRGYKVMKCHAKKGTRVSRWFKSEGTDMQFDYYRVDLDEALALLESM